MQAINGPIQNAKLQKPSCRSKTRQQTPEWSKPQNRELTTTLSKFWTQTVWLCLTASIGIGASSRDTLEFCAKRFGVRQSRAAIALGMVLGGLMGGMTVQNLSKAAGDCRTPKRFA
jgi:hypothetical protein